MRQPFPAIRVEGRTADVLELKSPGGRRISVPFLSFAALEDRVNGLGSFQVVQTSADALSVRVTPETGEDERAVRSAATTEVERILASHEVRAVRVTADERAPERTQGGKHRPVIPLKE